jgi:hypothetical protein
VPDDYQIIGGDKYNPTMLASGIDKKTYTPHMADDVKNAIGNMIKPALFLETLRNINWSRGYCWYCEMDGVPAPFHRGGVLGLPVKNISFKIAEGTTYPFDTSSVAQLHVPRTMGELGIVTIDMFDDEQQTLARFFERWYNQIYNPYKGVLPVTEACKAITIYKQKSTRRNVKRAYYNIDNNSMKGIDSLGAAFTWLTKGKVKRETEGFDFLVFPYGPLQFNWGTDQNDLNTLSVSLQIVHIMNQDFGDPCVSNGFTSILGNTSGNLHQGLGWLDRLADFI